MQKSAPQAPSHVPNVIALGNNLHADSCECLVSGNSATGAFGRLLAFLESSGLEIERSFFERDSQSGTFSALLLLRSQKSDVDIFGFVEKIMRLHLVASIEFSPQNNRIFSHFRFPIELINGKRTVLINPSSLLSLERSFQKSGGGGSNHLFFEEGRTYGVDLVELCPKKSLFDTDNEYIESVLDATQATGWGICKRQILEGREVLFLLYEPPVGAETNFMVGMIQGIAESALNQKLRVLTTQFDKSKNVLAVKMAFD
ncbi:MAG: hypothetical protein ACHQ1H_01405 [Nitrososphaerales archaeon]